MLEAGKTTTYSYDDLYRLTSETVAGVPDPGQNGAIGYELDKVGNRKARTSQLSALNPQQGLTYNARDWLSTDTYDANGNTVGSVILNGPITDTYDFENRLIVRTKPDGTTINIVYDADGIRIGKNVADVSGTLTTSTTWLVDTNNFTGYAQVVEERVSTSSGTTLRTYTYGTSLISVGRFVPNAPISISYFVADGHGNVRELTDETGAVTDRYTYDAFGNLIAKSGSTANNYLYCGEQCDLDLALYYNRARYLNTNSGRFWNADSFEGTRNEPQRLHKYLYVFANPSNATDPSGNFTLAEVMQTVGVVGTLTLIANVGISTIGASAAMADADGQPDAAIASVSEVGSARGVSGSVGFDVVLDFKSGRTYAYANFAAGLAPLSYFKAFRNVVAPSVTAGLIWNLNSPDEWSGSGITATYAYLPSSSLVQTLTFANGGATRLTTTKTYDNLNRIVEVTNMSPVTTLLPSAQYRYNAVNQRTRGTREDGSYWAYAYDALGQITNGSKYLADGSPAAGLAYGYSYDDIGNRKTSTANGQTSAYTASSLNQYLQRTVPPAVDVLGAAASDASVTVNGQSTQRQDESFYANVSYANVVRPVWAELAITAKKNSSTTTETRHAWLPANEAFSYDPDGNLIADRQWSYTWNAENRLVAMETHPDILPPIGPFPLTERKRLEFAYDAIGRRISKRVFSWNGAAWHPLYEHRFVYDGWNLIADLSFGAGSASPVLSRSYTWGLDVSGSFQGDGGVGGLLSLDDAESGATQFMSYDGNGNVIGLVNAADPTWSARYEYTAFGETVQDSGPLAKVNPFGFSTKFIDAETNHLYYGYRYYNPGTGRWLNRDPLGEFGSKNLYGFVSNYPVGKWDVLGLYEEDGHYYTTFDVLKGNNYSQKDAEEIAYYSQLGDEDLRFDARQAGYEIAGRNYAYHNPMMWPFISAIEKQKAHYYDIQRILHSLHDGDEAGVLQRRKCLEALLQDNSRSLANWEKGLLIHALGDAYAHTYLKDGKLQSYPPPLGHTVDSLTNRDPDVIANNPNTYGEYIGALNRAVGGGMTPDALLNLQTEMSRRHANQNQAIAAARRLAQDQFGYSNAYDPDGGKKLGPWGTLTDAQVQSLIDKIKKACCAK